MNLVLSGELSSLVATALVSLLGFLVASLVRSKLREAELQTRFLSSSKSEDEWRKRAIEADKIIDEATALACEARERAEEWKKKAGEREDALGPKIRKIDELQEEMAKLKVLADESAIHKANRQDLLAQLAKAEDCERKWRHRETILRGTCELREREIFAITRQKEDLEDLNRHLREEMEKMRNTHKREREKDDATIKRLTSDSFAIASGAWKEHAEEVERLNATIKHLRLVIAGDRGVEGSLLQEMRKTWGE